MRDARLDAIEARLAALEGRVTAAEGDRMAPVTGVDVALLERLQTRTDFEGDGISGGVIYAGALRLKGRPAVWQVERSGAELATVEPDRVAAVLGALGHPLRVAIVQALLEGPHTGPELSERLGVTSTGKLYHHLAQLLGAAVIVQPRRSSYAVSGARIVPLLALFSAAMEAGASLAEGE